MTWILLAALLVLAAGAVLVAVKARRRSADRRRPWSRAPTPRRCLQCRGTGWLNREPERTMNVVGDGFEDRHTPATLCPACGGTGKAPER